MSLFLTNSGASLVLANGGVLRVGTMFYVDYGRTSNGDGSAASPWKTRGNIVWATVTSALALGPVTIYFSSRATWNDDAQLFIPAAANATTNRLTLDGQSYYNLTASGTAVWQTETNANNRAVLTNSGAAYPAGGGNITVNTPNQFLTIRGMHILNGTWGGITLGAGNPTTDTHDIVIENNIIDTPGSPGQGIYAGFWESGCYNLTIRNNTIIDSLAEGIYVGHYNYLADTITGVIIEGNTVINTGSEGEGDIDVKPGCFGAIVRNNTVYSGAEGRVLAGIVVQASDVIVSGNTLYTLADFGPGTDGGNGIQVNADGADGVGKTLNNVLVYNNLIYSNEGNGLSVFATKAISIVAGLKILNNTFVSNTKDALKFSASGGGTIAVEVANNVLSAGSQLAFLVGSDVTLDADYNCSYGTGTLFSYQGTTRSWAQWQALGFDTNGLNADPVLTGSYAPDTGSPLIGAGEVRAEFTTDKAGVTRGASWDIGCYEKV